MPRRKRKESPIQKLKKFFGDELEIIDAKKPLTLLPSKQDFAGATKHDPTDCGYARTCKRLLDSHKCLFFKDAAYIDHVGADGVRRVYRYIPSSPTTRTLDAFDRDELDVNQVVRAFILKAPSISKTLTHLRRERRKYRSSARGRLVERARQATKKLRSVERDLETTQDRLSRLTERHSPQAPSVVETKQQVVRLTKRLAAVTEEHREKQREADKVRMRYATAPARARRRVINGRGGQFFWNA